MDLSTLQKNHEAKKAAGQAKVLVKASDAAKLKKVVKELDSAPRLAIAKFQRCPAENSPHDPSWFPGRFKTADELAEEAGIAKAKESKAQKAFKARQREVLIAQQARAIEETETLSRKTRMDEARWQKQMDLAFGAGGYHSSQEIRDRKRLKCQESKLRKADQFEIRRAESIAKATLELGAFKTAGKADTESFEWYVSTEGKKSKRG